MLKRLFILVMMCFVLLLNPSGATLAQQADEPIRVLFVGNSFIYFYNLPKVVSAMAHSQGVKIHTRHSTIGGSNLEQHWKGERNAKTVEMIKEGKYDYVVFNNHSLSSIETPDSFFEYGKKFADLVKENGGKPVFMMTWAYKSNPLMLREIADAYTKLGDQTSAYVVPGGELMKKAVASRPDLELYFDDKHPSANGTYLLGLAFYKFFTNGSVDEIPYRITTTDENGDRLYLIFTHEEDSKFLKSVVEQVNIETIFQP